MRNQKTDEPATQLTIRFDDRGLIVNGARVMDARVEHVEQAIGVRGDRVLLGPAHLVKPTDNRAVVFHKHGIVLLERIGDEALSQLDCVFDPRAASVPGLEPFSGQLVLFGVSLAAEIPRSQFIELSTRSTRVILGQIVFHSGEWIAYLTVEKRTMRKGPRVRIKYVSVGPARLTR